MTEAQAAKLAQFFDANNVRFTLGRVSGLYFVKRVDVPRRPLPEGFFYYPTRAREWFVVLPA